MRIPRPSYSVKPGIVILSHLLIQNRVSNVKFSKTCFMFEDWYYMLGKQKKVTLTQLLLKKIVFILFLEGGEGREKERE